LPEAPQLGTGLLSLQAMANQANSNADHVAKGGYIL
jgi:hypothetical protein